LLWERDQDPLLAIGDTVELTYRGEYVLIASKYAMYKTMEEVVKGEKYKERQTDTPIRVYLAHKFRR
jgi:hypothetical protein